MNTNKAYLIILFAIVFLAIHLAFAHEESDAAEEFDIKLTPQQAFQNDDVAIEAEIEKNNTHVEGLIVFFVVDKHDIGLSERIEANERETGHYVMKYAFKSAGMHEIHVEFAHDDEQIRKTFNINVEGASFDVEQYAIVSVILVLALAALYAMRTKKIKRTVSLSLVLVVLIGLSYSVYIVYSSGAAQRGVTVCVSENECYWSAHIHAEVTVDICGDDSFRFPVEKGPLNGSHTHEEKNLIHFHERLLIDTKTQEILDPQPLTLGAFFDAMEETLDSEKIFDKKNGDLCKGQLSTVKMFVNGRPSSSFRDYIWKDGDKIKIVFDERPVEEVAKEEQSTTFLAPQLTMPIILGFALIDSINPCVIGVLLLLITVLLKTKQKRAVLLKGSVYTLGVYVTYLIGGVTLLSVFNAVRSVQLISQMFYVFIGIFVLFAAFLEIKDFFWYGRGFSLAIPHRFVKTVEGGARGAHTGLISAFAFGSLVTLVELPCTGAPYLAIITMMSQSGVQFVNALILLLIYNLVFVIPLIAIICLAYKGIGYKKMELWRREHKGKMRLAVGLMLLGISVWIITAVLDWLLVYLIGGSILLIAIMYVIWKTEHHRIRHRR